MSTPLWDDAPAPHHPPLAGDVQADLCVVGLGGSGLACVREAQRLGARVVGIDASRVGGGAAGRNGGFLLAGLAPFYHDAVARFGRAAARRLYDLTLHQLDQMAAETPALVRRVGSLRIAESAEELADCDAQHAALAADGFPVERYEGPEGRGLLFPTDGVFQPLARCRALAEAAVRDGARLHEGTAALEISAGRVRTAGGDVHCEHVVVAVDGGLERLLPELTGQVRSARLQMLATAPAPEVRFPRPVYARWGYDYWQQLPDDSIALGGARDRFGDHEWSAEPVPTAEVQGALEDRLASLGVRAPVTHRWAAVVGFTPTGLPVCERVRGGVWAIGGYCGTGNVVGALLGAAVVRQCIAGDDDVVRAFAAAAGAAAGRAPAGHR